MNQKNNCVYANHHAGLLGLFVHLRLLLTIASKDLPIRRRVGVEALRHDLDTKAIAVERLDEFFEAGEAILQKGNGLAWDAHGVGVRHIGVAPLLAEN